MSKNKCWHQFSFSHPRLQLKKTRLHYLILEQGLFFWTIQINSNDWSIKLNQLSSKSIVRHFWKRPTKILLFNLSIQLIQSDIKLKSPINKNRIHLAISISISSAADKWPGSFFSLDSCFIVLILKMKAVKSRI